MRKLKVVEKEQRIVIRRVQSHFSFEKPPESCLSHHITREIIIKSFFKFIRICDQNITFVWREGCSTNTLAMYYKINLMMLRRKETEGDKEFTWW